MTEIDKARTAQKKIYRIKTAAKKKLATLKSRSDLIIITAHTETTKLLAELSPDARRLVEASLDALNEDGS